MRGFGRRGAILLAGLAAGIVAVGGIAIAQPRPAAPIPAVPLQPVIPLPELPELPLFPKDPPPPEPSEPPPAPEPAGPAETVVRLTNEERASAGCGPLRTDRRLQASAQAHSEDMATNDYFSHTSRDGRGSYERMSAAGHPAPGGENIAYGYPDPAEVVQVWMESAGHRRNILDCDFTTVGVGFDPDGSYWTQHFGY